MAKNVYIISPNGSIIIFTEDEYNEMLPEDMKKLYEEIGNKFEKKSDAKLVVKKFKAWKRLKDKGFEIESWCVSIGDDYYKTGQIVLNLNNVKNRAWDEYKQINEIKTDLDLLFGGEE